MPVTIPTDADYLLFPFTDDPDENKRISESLHVHKLLGGEIEEAEFDETYEKKEIDADTYAFWMLNAKKLNSKYVETLEIKNSESSPTLIEFEGTYSRLAFKDYKSNPTTTLRQDTDFTRPFPDNQYHAELYIALGDEFIQFQSDPTPLSDKYQRAEMPMPFCFLKHRFENGLSDRVKFVENEHENQVVVAPVRLNSHYIYGMTRVFQRAHWYKEKGLFEGFGGASDILDFYAFFLSFVYYKEKFFAITFRGKESGFIIPPLSEFDISKSRIYIKYVRDNESSATTTEYTILPEDTFF